MRMLNRSHHKPMEQKSASLDLVSLAATPATVKQEQTTPQTRKAVLKLLLVAPAPPPLGGIGRATVLLLSWLKQHPEISYRHVDTAPYWKPIHADGICMRFLGGVPQALRDLSHILARLILFRPDVIHLASSGSLAVLRDIPVMSLGRLFGAPTVYHLHFGRIPGLVRTGGWEWTLLSWAFRLAKKVIAIDRPTESALKRVLPAGKTVYLPNAISLEGLQTTVQNAPDQTRRVYFLGWVIPTKGIRELMEAWGTVGRDGWELLVAGPGDEAYCQNVCKYADAKDATYCQEVCKEAGAKAKLRFLGEVPHAEGWKLMCQADIFVLPSYTEGFPNVILEAMAAAKAILATRVGAIPEMLAADSPQPCGLLVEAKNSRALAESLERLMEDAPLRDELGRRGRRRVEACYDTRIVFPQLVDVWKRVREACDG